MNTPKLYGETYCDHGTCMVLPHQCGLSACFRSWVGNPDSVSSTCFRSWVGNPDSVSDTPNRWIFVRLVFDMPRAQCLDASSCHPISEHVQSGKHYIRGGPDHKELADRLTAITWKCQEVSYGVRRLLGDRVWRRWLWYYQSNISKILIKILSNPLINKSISLSDYQMIW